MPQMKNVLRLLKLFIVAHRLSTIRNADRILYIANQGIADEGTYEVKRIVLWFKLMNKYISSINII